MQQMSGRHQAAMGNVIPVSETLHCLMKDGLSRHEAIHAVGRILSRQRFNLMKGHISGADPNSKYYEELRKVTVNQWYEESSSE